MWAPEKLGASQRFCAPEPARSPSGVQFVRASSRHERYISRGLFMIRFPIQARFLTTNSLTAFIVTSLKVQSCKFYTNKYMIASTEITNTEVLAFILVLVFQLFSYKVLFISRIDN